MWKLSFRSLCNDSCFQWVKCLLTADSFVLFPFPLYPLLFLIALFLHFSFIIFNGCFVRRLTFYCYLMKWVWFTSWYIYLVRTLNVGTSNTNAHQHNDVTLQNDRTRCAYACAFAPHLNKQSSPSSYQSISWLTEKRKENTKFKSSTKTPEYGKHYTKLKSTKRLSRNSKIQ